MARDPRPKLRDAWRRLRGGELTPWRAAASVAVGIAIGVTPLYGLHWAILLAVCVPLRLDAVVAYLAANVSLPFIAPFIAAGEIETGAWLRTGHTVAVDHAEIRAHGAGAFVVELVIGTVVFAVVGGPLGGAIAYAITALARRRKRILAERDA